MRARDAVPPIERCGLPRRLLVMGYDAIIVTGLLLIATALVSPLDQGNQRALRDLEFTLYLAAVWFAYLAICWQRGMTLGMRAWGVVLRSDEGVPPAGWRTCLLRYGVSLLSAACLGLGFAWSLFDAQRRCWHDMASRTGLYRARQGSNRAA
jgi:uncharacterized RDD family membrane protein YckC